MTADPVEVMAEAVRVAVADGRNQWGVVEDVLAALDAAGLVVVPREPTDEMYVAGSQAVEDAEPDGTENQAAAVWGAMLSAAPTAQPAAREPKP